MILKRILTALAVLILSAGIAGAGQKSKNDKNNPIQKAKNDFLERYGFFVTDRDKVTYYQEALGVVEKENKIFKNLKTVEEVEKFIEIFFRVRDPNALTPENEFKDLIDKRIHDIENEIFATDFDIPGTRFKTNGGLRGDLAHVYLLYGAPLPHFKAKLPEGRTYSELMAWYYLDPQGRQLFRFLFYNKYGKLSLFKHYNSLLRFEDLFNTLSSPLREISNRPGPSAQDLYELWQELEFNDADYIFRTALLEFSNYSDVVIEGGNNKPIGKGRVFGALDPPEPAAITAAKFKPVIVGQPEDLTGREFIKSSYHSLIPGYFRISTSATTGKPSFSFIVRYSDLDWEIKSEKRAESLLSFRLSFQNKETKKITEFIARRVLALSEEYLEKNNMTAKEFLEKNKALYFSVFLGQFPNNIIEPSPGKLVDLIQGLESGTYIVNVDIRDMVTKKSAGGWREEIIVK